MPKSGHSTVRFSAAKYDLTASSLDVSGILWMEHLNIIIGDKEQAEYFYLNILGFTRDAGKSFHVNLGQQQFHLAEPKRDGEIPHIIAGTVGLVVPDLDTVRQRIQDELSSSSSSMLKETKFSVISDGDDCLTISCPWGNTFCIYSVKDDDKRWAEAISETANGADDSATPQKMTNMHLDGGFYGSHRMAVRSQPGIRFVQIACPTGTAPAIAKFYREMLHCTVFETKATTMSGKTGADETDKMVGCAIISVGPGVHVVFAEQQQKEDETEEISLPEAMKAMEGVHMCIYANDFAGIYQRLSKENLIWTNPRFVHLDTCDTWEEAAASRTLRFKNVIDLSTKESILELEHETRPLRHGQYLKVPKYEPK